MVTKLLLLYICIHCGGGEENMYYKVGIIWDGKEAILYIGDID